MNKKPILYLYVINFTKTSRIQTTQFLTLNRLSKYEMFCFRRHSADKTKFQ